mmetsp:Transcript_10322/g.21816  ORF Transcript_10322/g.21816 Transcript_10322/m.21816 type:complete len:120 (-) Transcript_10322:69-428(-)
MARVFGGEQQRSVRWILACYCHMGISLYQLLFLSLVMVTSTSVAAMAKLVVEIKMNHYSSKLDTAADFVEPSGLQVSFVPFLSILNWSKIKHPRIINKSDGNMDLKQSDDTAKLDRYAA